MQRVTILTARADSTTVLQADYYPQSPSEGNQAAFDPAGGDTSTGHDSPASRTARLPAVFESSDASPAGFAPTLRRGAIQLYASTQRGVLDEPRRGPLLDVRA